MIYLTNTKNAADWHKLSGYVPIRLSAAKLLEDEGWFKSHPVFAVAGGLLAPPERQVALLLAAGHEKAS